jgi:hypothetical protein
MFLTRSIRLCAALILAGSCGSSQKQADDTWQAPPAEKSERTIDRWTRTDEDTAIARACREYRDPARRFPLRRLREVWDDAGQLRGGVARMGRHGPERGRAQGVPSAVASSIATASPEATYEVFVDFYMCGPGEKFQ